MKKLRLLLYGTVVALALAACSTPPAVDSAALLSDADLDGATQIEALASTTGLASQATADSRADLGFDRSGSTPLLSGALDSLSSQGLARGQEDLGGWLAYVEQKGKIFSIRLVDLNDSNQAERRGDFTVYSGSRAVQSVAVSRDGKFIAFTAQSKDGDFDLYTLDVQRNKVSSTRTPAIDERNVSMSLWGESLAWQGGSEASPSLSWYHDDFGGYYDFDAALWAALLGLPMHTSQASISGNGLNIVVVEESGSLASHFGYGPFKSLARIQFSIEDGIPSLETFTLFYYGSVLESPSLSYAGDLAMFKEVWSGVPFLSVYDFNSRQLTDLLGGVDLDHPYITADGKHATFSAFTDAMLVDLEAGTITPLSPDTSTVDSATYWARGNFTSYSGVNNHGTFVRPEDGLIDAAGRTVGYHVQEFRPISDDLYSIESTQQYDGYLNLYVDNFNPKKPDQKLLASNDDYQHAWSEAMGGSSRIVAQLQRNKTYYIVTSACGAAGTPCGPSQGKFTNLIADGATPPAPPAPYTQLPEPDNTGFNITLRFWDDSLTDTEKDVFTIAADRWSEVITGDIPNIPNFVLTETEVTDGAPGIQGELDDVIIDAAKVAIDGPGGVLARAGAFYVRTDSYLPIYGIMEFDEAEFGPGGFFEGLEGFAETIMHEMGHVLGISRGFFNHHGYTVGAPANTSQCSDVANGDDPRYVGPAGADAWHNYYGADSASVPLANTGGCGTADSHWREIYLQDELMTGYAQGGGEPLSRVTIGALQDLGYEVDFNAADDWSIPLLPTLRQVSPNAKDYRVEFDFTTPFTFSLLGQTTGVITPVDLGLDNLAVTSSGCEAADFVGFPAGNIALIRRGGCAFGDMAKNALAAGASGILVGNQGNSPDRMAPASATFGEPVAIVGVPVSFDVLVELAELSQTGPVTVSINTDPNNTAGLIGPQALPKIVWHLAEELLPVQGTIDADGTLNWLGN